MKFTEICMVLGSNKMQVVLMSLSNNRLYRPFSMSITVETWSQDSSVGMATGYGLGGRGSISDKGKIFYVLHSVRTDSEAHPASYPMGTGGSFPDSKAAGAWNWPLPSI
jgi:hypothetical protein